MAFKRAQNPTFKVKVTVPVPNDKGGHDNNTFMAVFKRTTTEELSALREQNLTDAELVLDRMVDWELVDADTNEAVAFARDELQGLLSIQPTPKYTAMAFWENVLGGKR